MKNLIRLTDYTVDDVYDIFKLSDEVRQGKYSDILKGKSVVLFFPGSSIRTRVTFEKGIYLLGGQPIVFSTETLDKEENLKDACRYVCTFKYQTKFCERQVLVLWKKRKYRSGLERGFRCDGL